MTASGRPRPSSFSRPGMEKPVSAFSNLNMHLTGAEGREIPGSLYCKVIGTGAEMSRRVCVRFTSKSREIEAFLRDLLDAEAKLFPQPEEQG